MSQPTLRNDFTFHDPAMYRIVVQGHVDERASDYLGGMRIEGHTAGEDIPVTMLVGRLSDQAALSGVLQTIYEMHLPVLEVKKLSD